MQEQIETEPYVLSVDEFGDILEDTSNNDIEAILQDVGENGKVHPLHRKCISGLSINDLQRKPFSIKLKNITLLNKYSIFSDYEEIKKKLEQIYSPDW